jgi:hypothetical protein
VYVRGMRRTVSLLVVPVVLCAVLTGCGGGDDGDDPQRTVGASELAGQQDRVDAVARRVVGALTGGVGAEPASAGSLGRGLYAGCDDGDPDEASYFVDTFVTYDPRPPAQAATDVAKALRDAGIDPDAGTVDGVTVDLSPQEKRGASAGQNIFVSTGCLPIGKKAIADFNAGNGRDVPAAP